MSNWIIEPFSITAKLNNRWNAIRLRNGENDVGRQPTSTIHVNCAKTSQRHCKLLVQEGKLYLNDRSTFGSTVVHLHMNDYSLYMNNANPIRLLHGDWISFDNPLLHGTPMEMQWFRMAMRSEEDQKWIEEEKAFNEAERIEQMRNRLSD